MQRLTRYTVALSLLALIGTWWAPRLAAQTSTVRCESTGQAQVQCPIPANAKVELARIYTVVGEQDKAVDQLEALLKTPYFLSPAWLRIDPNFESLRGNPRFQKLVAGAP
jgi:hypothetical protein